MVNLPQKIAAITAGAVLGCLALEAKPAQAAEFYDYAEFGFELENYGGGYLFFEVTDDELSSITSILTGVGKEVVSLDELESATSYVDFVFDYEGIAFEYPYYRLGFHFKGDGSWTTNDVNNAIFNFDSGELIGLDLDLRTNITSGGFTEIGGCYYCDLYDPPTFYSSTITEYNNLLVKGDQFIQTVEPYWQNCKFEPTLNFPPDDEFLPYVTYPDEPTCDAPFLYSSDTVSGDINFTTYDPLELPPQSVPEPSTLASLSLLGLGLLVKKKNINPRQKRD
ncbi:MAG: PEP-CTERM sorting domain-containing protein [Coleofasciculus chthonoplastes F3-SA18-01]|jgi:hypothetical protein|uniref:PEP-CTERM sorting domain-containing protein n=1 Tax=Coleofasciculus chthonoplastes TaxID=64178 RepID=UPI0032F4C92B